MPVEFLGMIGVKPSESNAAMHIIGGGIDLDYLCQFTKAHEDAGFDGVLVGYTSAAADGLHVAQAAAACSRPHQVPHRPPARIRRPHPRRAQVRHPRLLHRRPRLRPHHHRRTRRRAAPRRRLENPRRALPPHRRIPQHHAPHLGARRQRTRTVRLRRRVLPGRRRRTPKSRQSSPAASPSTSAAHPTSPSKSASNTPTST